MRKNGLGGGGFKKILLAIAIVTVIAVTGGFGGMDLYYVDLLENESYGSPVNLGPDINTEADEVFPFVFQADYLFFSQKSAGGNLSPKLAINTVDVRWHVLDLQGSLPTDGCSSRRCLLLPFSCKQSLARGRGVAWLALAHLALSTRRPRDQARRFLTNS